MKAGVGTEDRVERLLEVAKTNGEVDKMLAVLNRTARREELLVMDTKSLQKLCEETGTDPLVKEIMVERLMSHESEFGRTKLEDEEPRAKKARVSRK